MAFNGPPMKEHLLARVRRWISYCAGAFGWALNNNTERPDAERPEENRIVDNPPLPPHGGDENSEGRGRFDQPSGRRGEEREEELNDNDDQNVGAPSPPLQLFPPPIFGMDWGQHAAAVPVYHPLPHGYPYAFPFVFPYAYPYALLHAFPHAFPYANPFAFVYAPPYAPPYVSPYAPRYAYPFAFAYDLPYVPPYALLHDAPYVHPYAAPHAFPPAAPHAFPPAAPHANPQEERPEQDPGIDAAGVDEEDGLEIPEFEVSGLGHPETIGPLTTEECSGFFSSDSSLEEEEDAVVPSTSGLSSSTRRSREETEEEEEAAAKRPRWSHENDSD